jgi:hypothetical protein
MTMNKVLIVIFCISLAGVMVSGAAIPNRLIQGAPRLPNVATGHTIALDTTEFTKGHGIVYLDENEWNTIAPYLYAFRAFLALSLAPIFLMGIIQAYRGFIEGWRSK